MKWLLGWRGYVLIAAVCFAAGWVTNSWRYERKIAIMEAKSAQALADAQAKAREIEQRRWTQREEAVNEARQAAKDAQMEAAIARDNNERLRRQLSEYVERARNSALAGTSAGESGGSPTDLLAGMLQGSERRAGEIARYADELRAAGFACERIYDSLKD